jgi:hypothetical protein
LRHPSDLKNAINFEAGRCQIFFVFSSTNSWTNFVWRLSVCWPSTGVLSHRGNFPTSTKSLFDTCAKTKKNFSSLICRCQNMGSGSI